MFYIVCCLRTPPPQTFRRGQRRVLKISTYRPTGSGWRILCASHHDASAACFVFANAAVVDDGYGSVSL